MPIVSDPAGKMYEVNINADPSHFLDWDKPLSEQHPVVQDAANKIINDIEQKNAPTNYWAGYSGGEQPGTCDVTGADVAGLNGAAQKLSDAGIPGIKYLDQGSRGTGAGTSNYVVFNDKLIDILKKYGLAGMLGGGGAGAAMQQQQPQVPLASMQAQQ